MNRPFVDNRHHGPHGRVHHLRQDDPQRAGPVFNIWTKEGDRLDQVVRRVREVAMSGEQERMVETRASQARSWHPHLTQVLNIQMKRVVTLPQPEVKKMRMEEVP